MSRPEDISPEAWLSAGDVIAGSWAHDIDLQGSIARAIMAAKAEVLIHHDLVDCLSDMTEHYVQLAGCGDCGNWDPEKESEVIAARKMIAAYREVSTAHKNKIAEE